MPKENQKTRILNTLKAAGRNWVDGQKVFLHGMYISQYHRCLKELKEDGHVIEGRWVAGENWKEYRIKPRAEQKELFQSVNPHVW